MHSCFRLQAIAASLTAFVAVFAPEGLAQPGAKATAPAAPLSVITVETEPDHNSVGRSCGWLSAAGLKAGKDVSNLPSSAQHLILDFDGRLYWNKSRIDRAGLKAAAKQAAGKGVVIVEGHPFARRSDLEAVVRVLNDVGIVPDCYFPPARAGAVGQ